MMNVASKIALALAILAGSAMAQSRYEQVPAQSVNNVYANIGASNFVGGNTLVGLTAYSTAGIPFGSGTLVFLPSTSAATVRYSDSASQQRFEATPQFAWGAWAAGLGSVAFDVL